ncbi:Peptidyl-prolyl cis-trans isomerase, FKBP-type [Penicillium italicum]|uniref:peptidylprolyl isomerase n=1 Tax=Penicillium italicum TaxID=40296 RepID=A0A0A2LDJ5_PENIT|nr:Peptidyl-prolyl cis-trans isomerase, FKBP-type [Penicillium italicum]
MRLTSILVAALGSIAAAAELGIEVTHAVECTRKTTNGDEVAMHYRGTLQSDGSEFDSSYSRNAPLTFKLGTGRVIKGWDQGLLDMCIGEKRTLTIPPEFGYGDRGIGPIPGGATLVFETELVGIDGVKDEL